MRRALTWILLAVPLAVDPFGPDALSAKILLITGVGALLLFSEAWAVLAGRRGWLRPVPIEWLLLGLGLWSAASLGWAASPSLGFLGVAMALVLPAVARAVRRTTAGPGDGLAWMGRLVGVGLVVVLIDGVGILRRAGQLPEEQFKYASPLFTHNNMAAAWAVMLLPLAAGLWLATRHWRWLAAGAAVLAYLVLLRSRAGLASALVGLAVVLAAWRWGHALRRPGRRTGLVLAGVVALGLVLPFSGPARGLAKDGYNQAILLLQEWGLGDRGESLFRARLWGRALGLVEQAPLRGVGAGNFMVAYSGQELGKTDIPHAHSDALQVLVELGAPGLLLFLGLLATGLWTVLGLLAAPPVDARARAVAPALLGSFVVFALTGCFEVPFAMAAPACALMVLVGVATGAASPATSLPPRRGRLVAGLLLCVSLFALLIVAVRVPVSAWHARAAGLRGSGDLAGARELLLRMTRLRVGAHLPHQDLGELAWAAGDWDAAVAHYGDALALWPHGTDLLLAHGQALLALGRPEQALQSFRAAYAMNPNDPATTIALVRALERAGHLEEAIARAEFLLQSEHLASLDLVQTVARMWSRRAAELPEGDATAAARVEGLVAARHFYAELLQDGEAARAADWNREFKHLTHQLQLLPGAPDSWWKVYDRFLDGGGWTRPSTALWTALDGDGQRLFPGWQEKAGPPLPRELR